MPFLDRTSDHKLRSSDFEVSCNFTFPYKGKSMGEVMTILALGNVKTVPPKLSCSRVKNFLFSFAAVKEADIPAGPAPTIITSY